ncbi:hypothetical protein [Vibrio sp. WXL103]|uniref:hypothetical protein n=1 Tax=Vibrio sp. WXL103 TaxID=3450710 RepID=UPI003EC62FFC
MKRYGLLALIALSHLAHATFIEPNSLKLNGFNIYLPKAEIQALYGEGEHNQLYDECGYDARDYRLMYDDITFIGNDEQGFFLDTLDVTKIDANTLTFRDQPLSRSTTMTEFAEGFGLTHRDFNLSSEEFARPTKDETSAILPYYSQDADSYIIFTFDHEGLVSLRHLTPC